jgi:glycerol-3-phosphate cytidylyltransferase|tara:strand:+ start:1481 stop:1894 length:414 start_codon:yes stop_codon:yes gene_type:complete
MKRIGFTCSAFDLLHAGHVTMLEEAKEQCDYLICGLQIDPSIDRPEKNTPVQTVSERFIQLRAVKWVDHIVPYTTEIELLGVMQLIRPHVRIIGEEYRGKDFTGKDWCRNNDIDIYYNERKHEFSTSELRKRLDKGC